MHLRPRILSRPLGADSSSASDAIAESPDRAGTRYFVPSLLPCGECPRCRRGHAAVCERSTSPFAKWQPDHSAPDVPDRFITALDSPETPCPLSDKAAVLAGRVALILDAVSRAGLCPGDLAVWVGDSPLAQLGAWVSRDRGAQSLRLAESALGLCDADTGPQALLAIGAQAIADLTATPDLPSAHGLGDTKFFFCDLPSAQDALALVSAGNTLSLVGTVRHGIPNFHHLSMARILVTTGYHPDLIPEALALMIRTGDHLLPLLSALASVTETTTWDRSAITSR